MYKLSKQIIDFRDDEDGEIFKQIFPNFEDIPEIIKQASTDEPKDHEYAVIINDNGTLFKKFAMHDAGNTLLSLCYLHKVANSLPAEVVKVAKEGIFEAVERFKMEVPPELKDIGKGTNTPVVTRERSWKTLDNLVDLQDTKDGRSPDAGETPRGKELLKGKYPVDDYYQTKQAQKYWEDYWRDFTPADRKEYCTKLANRMDQLLMDVPEDIRKYAGTEYSYDIDNHLQLRRDLVDEDQKETLDLLVDKRAYVEPLVFVQALETFDKMAGLEKHWDSLISDPYRTTFGTSLEKVADETWRYSGDGQHIREDHLVSLTQNAHDVKQILGSEMTGEFLREPKKTFEKLPQKLKTMIARRAAQEIL